MEPCGNCALKGLFEVVCVAGGLAGSEFITAVSTSFQKTSIAAIATSSGDIFLYCQENEKSFIKVIPWSSEENPKPSALAFDPTSEWLLVATENGSIYIVPIAKHLKHGSDTSENKFSTNDIVIHQTYGSRAKPTAIVWWNTLTSGVSVAIIGTELGELCFVELSSGKDVGGTYITVPVKELFLCHDNSWDTVYLLITGTEDRQWHLVLEQKSQHYMFPLENISPEWDEEESLVTSLPLVVATPSPRLRLMNLKQLSVEKFQLLKQRLSEAKHSSKKKLSTENKSVDTCDIDEEPSADSLIITPQTDSSSALINASQSTLQTPAVTSNTPSVTTPNITSLANPSPSSSIPCENDVTSSISARPERICKFIYDIVATPHIVKEKCLLAGIYKPNSCLMVYSPDLESSPLYVYKLPEDTEQIILHEELIYALRKGSTPMITVVSTFYSASNKIDGEIDNKINPVLQDMHLPDGEEILQMFSWPSIPNSNLSSKGKDNFKGKEEGFENKKKRSENEDLDFDFEHNIELTSHTKPNACLVVTKKSLFICQTRKSVESLFMELTVGINDIDAANRLAVIFSLDSKYFELAGDYKLQRRCFASAITLYKQSHCPHVKCALKFAWSGYIPEFLTYMSSLTSGSGAPDLGVEQRKHLATLAIIAHLHQLSLPVGIRTLAQQQTSLRNLLLFIRNNLYYDEILTLVISAATWRWETLQYLASNRGLLLEKLHALLNFRNSPIITASNSKDDNLQKVLTSSICREKEKGFLHCISDPELRGVLLLNPLLARSHMAFVLDHLDQFDVATLRRLAALYDPSQPAIKPFLLSAYFHSPSASYSQTHSKGNQSSSLLPPASDDPISMETLTQIFLAILIKLNQKRGWKYNPDLLTVKTIEPVKREPFYDSDVKRRPLACGYGHSLVIIEGLVYSWGLGDYGCLGHGPKSSTSFDILGNLDPVIVAEFNDLANYPIGPELFCTKEKDLVQTPEGSDGECYQPKVISYLSNMKTYSIACGKNYSLAITNYGVYGWGNSRYGQVGTGGTGRYPRPTLITSFIKMEVIQVVCGQYHSLAVTKEGRLYSWGWGVHGQLGHGNVEDCLKPTLVKKLSKKKIVHADAGYAHSVALTDKGHVYAWGCSTYGQVGTGGITKVTSPAKLSFPCKVIHLAAGYFHNVVSTEDHKVYIWGSNPASLRVQAQIQRRNRSMQQVQTSSEAGLEDCSSNDKISQNSSAETTENIQEKSPSIKSESENVNESKESEILDGNQSEKSEDVTDSSLPPSNPCQKISSGCHLVSANTVPSCDPMELSHLLPKEVEMPHNYGAVKYLSAGSQHSLLLTTHGALFAWGRNISGQLGTGNRRELLTPTQILDDVYITAISSGADFNLAFDNHNQVWGWGSNYYNQLGQGVNSGEEKPQGSKVFMLRTSKRVLKVPHSIHSNVEIPRTVAHLPIVFNRAGGFSAHYKHLQEKVDLNDMGILSGIELASLESPSEDISEKDMMEDKDDGLYGTITLHSSLAFLHPHYSSKNLSQMLLDFEGHQALATLYTLEKQHSKAMHHQLCALLSHAGDEENLGKLKQDGFVQKKNDETSPKDNSSKDEHYSMSHVSEAVRIMDYFLHLQTEESQSGMRMVLQEGIGLWLTHSLPIPQLEELLLTHLPRTVYPLALLLFGEESSFHMGEGVSTKLSEEETVYEATARILSQLSTKFCLNLCSSVISHLQSGEYNLEQLDSLNQLARLNPVGETSKEFSAAEVGEVVEVKQEIISKPASEAINLAPEDVSALKSMSEEGVQPEKGAKSKRDLGRSKSQSQDKDSVLFTCGHHFTNKDFKETVLPQLERTVTAVPGLLGKTARVLLDQYHSDQPQMACPHCVLAHLTIKLTKHNQPS